MIAPATLDDLELDGKTVLVRVDFNVPLTDEGEVSDDTRIRAAIPTIRKLRALGAKVVLCSHLGRPKSKVDQRLSLLPAAARLSELIEMEVVFSHSTVGPEVRDLVAETPAERLVVLENLRFHPGEKAGDAGFARQLAELGDVFVNDAFGAMHRAHASITGVPGHLPSAAGLLVESELKAIGRLITDPDRPVGAILGGAKVSDKIGVIDSLSKQVDHLFVGGAMAYTFLAALDQPVGASRVEDDQIELAGKLLRRIENRRATMHLPIDHVVAHSFAEDALGTIVAEIPDGQMGLDIGPATVESWEPTLRRCQTLFWNGPMGVFEWEAFSAGSKRVATILAECEGFTVVGGGDSAAAIAKFGLADKVSHVSTGGGASLAYIEKGDLVGLEALRQARP